MNGDSVDSLPHFEVTRLDTVIRSPDGTMACRMKGATTFGELKNMDIPVSDCDYVKLNGKWFQPVQGFDAELIERDYQQDRNPQ